jgi:hypothetical protein
MPCVFAVCQILLFLTVCRSEPVNYLIANGRDYEATELLKKIYTVDEGDGLDEINKDDIYRQFIEHQRSTLDTGSTEITLNDAVFGPVYGTATKVCFVLNLFNQSTGVAAIAIYITRMLFNLKEKTSGQFPISPQVGSYIFGIVNMTAAASAIIPSLFFGRKSILLVG